MKKGIVLVGILAVPLLLTGCFAPLQLPTNTAGSTVDTTASSTQPVPQGESKTADGQDVVAGGQAPKEIKKFYPTVAPPPTGGGSPADPAPSPAPFTVSQELFVKLYLVDKYDPGVCYGLPGPVSDESISSVIAHNQDLADFVRGKYKLSQDLEVYNKIKQLNGILLQEQKGGQYYFNFTDGECCVLKAYEGSAQVLGQQISDTIDRQETKNNPC